MAQYLTIPKSEIILDDDNNEILNDITDYINANVILLNFGDLIRIQNADDEEPGGYYRNNDLYIWDGYNTEKLDTTNYMSGVVPSHYRIYEEPEYFTLHHWDEFRFTEEQHRSFANTHEDKPYVDTHCVWITGNDQIIENYTETADYIYTWWVDDRNAKHYLVFDDRMTRRKLLTDFSGEVACIEYYEPNGIWESFMDGEVIEVCN
jgi:hypothetical protein